MIGRLWKRRAVRRTLYATVVLIAAISTMCWYIGIRRGRDIKAYVGMALECHSVWRGLALHRVYEGQPVDEVIERTNPEYVVRNGRFAELSYQEPLSFTAVQIVAMDGKISRASAASCTWHYTFFDTMTDAHTQEMSASFDNDGRTLEYTGKPIVRSPIPEQRGVTMP